MISQGRFGEFKPLSREVLRRFVAKNKFIQAIRPDLVKRLKIVQRVKVQKKVPRGGK